jgi:hypothetical protein
MNTTSTTSQLSTVLKIEAKDKGMKQIDVSKMINKQDRNLWQMIRKGSVKFALVCKICDVLNLELVIRNREKNCEYIINSKNK